MAGRPKYEPSESDRATVEAMAAAGIAQDTIARCIGARGIDEKTLRRHFRQELDTAVAKSNALVATQVLNAAQRGEAWACCFWLKCRAGWRERSAIEHSGPDGSYLLSDEQARRMSKRPHRPRPRIDSVDFPIFPTPRKWDDFTFSNLARNTLRHS